MRPILSLTLCLLFGAVSTSGAQDDLPQRPQGAPPTITTLRMADDGKLEILDVTMRRETRTVVKKVIEGDKEYDVTRTEVVEVPVVVIRQFPNTNATIYDLDGNKYAWDDVAKMLAKPTPVLLSRGPTKIDPFYRKMFLMGTLILVLPPEPAADYIAPPPTPSTPRR